MLSTTWRTSSEMQKALTSLHGSGGHAHGNYTGAMQSNRDMWA